MTPYYHNRMIKLYHGDCRDLMSQMESGSVDLTVTSPPYDNLRTYEGSCEWNFDAFKGVASGLWRVTKEGGVVVWVVGDATINGSETGTSFRQALYFKEIGFNIHDTMIWVKKGGGAVGSHMSYTQNFEYMFVMTKGTPNTYNLIRDVPNLSFGKKKLTGRRNRGGDVKKEDSYITKNRFSKRNNWWLIGNSRRRKYTGDHPAVFPINLVLDHIKSWSNEGDTVFDPFGGSGTTGVASMKLNRNCVLCEKVDKYCDIARKRLTEEEDSMGLFNFAEKKQEEWKNGKKRD